MHSLKYLLLLLVALSIYSCDEDEMPEPPEEEELITTVIYTLTGDSETITLTFKDVDGDGAMPAEITGGTFKAGVDYTGSISLLNESIDPAEDINPEIEEEDDEHQFFFSNDLGINIGYSDADGDGNPVGLQSTWTDLNPGTGSLTVTLRHMPVKNAAGVSDGDITNADGSTDVEVTFPIIIE